MYEIPPMKSKTKAQLMFHRYQCQFTFRKSCSDSDSTSFAPLDKNPLPSGL